MRINTRQCSFREEEILHVSCITHLVSCILYCVIIIGFVNIGQTSNKQRKKTKWPEIDEGLNMSRGQRGVWQVYNAKLSSPPL